MSDDESTAQARSVTVTDPTSLRALAHPLRLKLLGLLRVEGPRSVGQLADLVDEAPGTVSYHLGTLAKSGFVVEAPELANDGRERWWRATHEQTHFDPAELRDDPARRGASVALRQSILQSYLAEQLAALDAESTLDAAWLGASTGGDAFAHLTLEEFARFGDELEALVEKWTADRREPREGTRVTRVLFSSFPRP